MTTTSKVSTVQNHSSEATANILANFPVGGADPDFVVTEFARPAICAVPFVGKRLPQCK